MQISFEKFVKITALLAGSASFVQGCTIETVDDAAGGETTAKGGASNGGTTQNGGAGGKLEGGAPSEEGGAGAGAGGTSGGSLGMAGAAGAAEGGASAGAGGARDNGGAGGVDAGGGAENGGEGGVGTCVSGAPADEGGGYDCSTLPYAGLTCPNPSGEGSPVAVPGVEICERYADQRSGSVALLTTCLAAIPSTLDQCATAGKAVALGCETAMQAGTCSSSQAQSACAAIHAKCAEVSEASCVRDLSPLGPSKITAVQSCVTSSTDTQCGYVYRDCRGVPDQALAVADACTDVLAACPSVVRATCESRLDVYGKGKLYETTYYYYRDCMAKSSAACATAFDTCTK